VTDGWIRQVVMLCEVELGGAPTSSRKVVEIFVRAEDLMVG
jgi:hypothetical protein